MNRNLLVVHRSRHLSAEDLTIHEGFPVTGVERTILNMSASSTISQIEGLIAEGDRLGLIDWDVLKAVSERGPGWYGIGKLRFLVGAWDPRVSDTKSAFERKFIALCRSRSIELPLVNTVVEGFEVDCLWRAEKLIVELDSRRFHDRLGSFEKDRRKDVILANAGYEVRRITYRQLQEDPDYVVNEVLRKLRD